MDMALLYKADSLTIDAALKRGLLLTDDTLATAVLISLFTDKLAGPDDELPATEDWRRGWWGDCLTNKPGDKIGSHFWLLLRCKQTEVTRLRALQYAREAFAWMLEDGVAKAVDVEAAWMEPATGVLALGIVCTRPDGSAERYYFGLNIEKGGAVYYAV